MRLQRPDMKPHTGQAFDPLGIIILQSISWSQRRTVQADISMPCVVLSSTASVAPLQRVRQQP